MTFSTKLYIYASQNGQHGGYTARRLIKGLLAAGVKLNSKIMSIT